MPNANQLASIWKKLHHERCGPVIGNEVVTCVNGRNPNGKIIEPIYLQPGRGRLHYLHAYRHPIRTTRPDHRIGFIRPV